MNLGRVHQLLLGWILSLALGGCASACHEIVPVIGSSEADSASPVQLPARHGVDAVNELSLGMLHKFLSAGGGDHNVLFSPTGFSMGMSILLRNSCGLFADRLWSLVGGRSPELLGDLASYNSDSFREYPSTWSTSFALISPSTKVTPDFRAQLTDELHAEVSDASVDENQRASESQEAWIARQSRGGLTNTGFQLPADWQVALFQFSGLEIAWQEAFSPTATKPGVFFGTNHQILNVPFVEGRLKGARVSSEKFAEFEMGQLATQDPDIKVYFLLPPPGISLADFSTNFEWEKFQRGQRALQGAGVTWKMPKLDLRTDKPVALMALLADLGAAVPPGDQSAMCKMYVGESGPVLDFSQHTHFELGESGLKATSMTTMVGAEILGRVPLRSTTFVLDRPFLVLVVRESNDALLYVAAISDPIPLAK